MSLPLTQGYINTPLNSKLAQAPYDVRREIFDYIIPQGIHIFLHRGTLRASECYRCPVAHEWSPGKERTIGLPKGHKQDHVQAPHWATIDVILGSSLAMRGADIGNTQEQQ
jgi:hypothetical protein